ncbi:MAG TPA: hypothetical protein VN493_13490 [Thermoanaerobaculia bacterium]|nr:hypothetical protein [Thermoanaerobaculia bacterium]
MRSRSLLFLFAFLLSIASLAGAAPAGMSTPATDVESSPEDPSCNPLLAKLGISALDSTSSPQDAGLTVCGACSVSICRGMGYNNICQGGIVIKRCIAAYGLECSVDGLPQCQCWSGPLP